MIMITIAFDILNCFMLLCIKCIIKGRSWKCCDVTMQLGEDTKIKWLSSSSQWLWAVDSRGRCLMRSAVPDNDIMVSAWLPVENPNDEVLFKEVCDKNMFILKTLFLNFLSEMLLFI